MDTTQPTNLRAPEALNLIASGLARVAIGLINKARDAFGPSYAALPLDERLLRDIGVAPGDDVRPQADPIADRGLSAAQILACIQAGCGRRGAAE